MEPPASSLWVRVLHGEFGASAQLQFGSSSCGPCGGDEGMCQRKGEGLVVGVKGMGFGMGTYENGQRIYGTPEASEPCACTSERASRTMS
jgi:hypothetical protein